MAGLIGSGVCRWSCNNYQRLPAPTTPRRPAAAPGPGRGVRLGRRTVLLGSATRRFSRLRRQASARWPSPLQLLRRIVDAYAGSLLSRPLNILRAGVSSPGAAAAASSPLKPRRAASPGSRRRDGAAGGRGVMLNICVAEALLLRRSTSEVRRSPLQQPRKAARAPGRAARSSDVCATVHVLPCGR